MTEIIALNMLLQYLVKFRHILFSSIFAFIVGCTITLMFLKIDSCSVSNLEVGKILLKERKSETLVIRKEESYLLILIVSSPNNLELRNAIRSSWLSYCKETDGCKCNFVIGSSGLSSVEQAELLKEQNEYNDLILLENIEDSYANLTSKVLEAFIWAARSVDFRFLLKCDDDSFVRVPIIVNELQSLSEESASNLYWGFFDGRAQVKKKGRWKESNWILCDFYLPYALGGGYVLSKRLVDYIEHNAQYLQKFSSEDVSVGVWLANLSGVKRRHDPRFDTEYRSRGCHNTYLVTHKCGAMQFRQFWSQLQKDKSTLCPGGREFRSRLSYEYNWSVPPSQCCARHDSAIP